MWPLALTESFSHPPSFTGMPLSYDEVAAALAHLTAAQGFPLPPRPIDRENAIAMYQVAEAVAHAFIGDGPGHPPWVSGVSEGAQNWARDVIEVAEPAMERLEWLADHVKVFKGKVEGNFMSTFGAPDGHEGKRPLIKVSQSNTRLQHLRLSALLSDISQLLFGAGEERAFHYITRKVAGMLAGSRDLRSVDARLFVGYRDWHSPSSTAWLRAKVGLSLRRSALSTKLTCPSPLAI